MNKRAATPPALPRRKRAEPLDFSARDRRELEMLARRRTTPARLAARARIVLACGDGGTQREIAARLGVSVQLVNRWRQRFIAGGLAALEGGIAAGRPRASIDRRVEAALGAPPIEGWTTRSLAAQLGVSQPTVTRVWHHLALLRDPSLAVTGLFAHRRDCALLLTADGRPVMEELGDEAALRATLARLREQLRRAGRLTTKARGALKLRRFLKRALPALRGRVVLVFAHAEAPSRGVRRLLERHDHVETHVLGAAARWWELIAASVARTPSRNAARLAASAADWLALPLEARPFQWLAPSG